MLLIRLPHERLLAELLIYLRQHRRIAYYVSNDTIELVVLDRGDERAGRALVAQWQQQHPGVTAEFDPPAPE